MGGDDEADQETVRKVASACVRRGRAVSEIRAYNDRDPFWGLVADEMELLEARRRGFRVIPGGTGPFRLPGWQPRLVVIAGNAPLSAVE